jgi:hypothetical protein
VTKRKQKTRVHGDTKAKIGFTCTFAQVQLKIAIVRRRILNDATHNGARMAKLSLNDPLTRAIDARIIEKQTQRDESNRSPALLV